MIQNKAGKFLGSKGGAAGFGGDTGQNPNDEPVTPLGPGPAPPPGLARSPSINQGGDIRRAGGGSKFSNPVVSGGAVGGGGVYSDIINRSSRSIADARHAPAGAASGAYANTASLASIGEAWQPPPRVRLSRASSNSSIDLDSPPGRFLGSPKSEQVRFDAGGGVAFGGSDEHTSGKHGWGTSGTVVGGRFTGVQRTTGLEDAGQKMEIGLSSLRRVDLDGHRDDSPRSMKSNEHEERHEYYNNTEHRASPFGKIKRDSDFDPGHHDSDVQVEGDDEEEKARLGLPTRFSNLKKDNPLLLNPRDPRVMYWDALVGFFLLFTASFTPYEVAFMGDSDSMTITIDAVFVINRIVDLGFLVDMGLNFFLPVQTADNRLITDHRIIIRKYLLGWFPIDLVSIIPYDLIAVLFQDDSLSNLKVLRAIRLLRLAKLLRIIRLGRLFRRFEATHEVNYAALALNKFGFGILFLAHWMACLFYLVAVTEQKEWNWVTGYFSVDADGAQEVPKGTLYVASVYWAVATLSTLGYGDVIPETNAERLFATVCTFIGGAVYAFLLGSVCSIITNLDEGSNTFYRQMDELNRFMKEKAITPELRIKLRDYFRFRRNSRALVEWSGVMHLMSDSLRLEFAEEVFGGWIRAMPIFGRDCPERLPAMLSAHLSSLVLSPHEDLMSNPVRRDCLFIVEKGLIAHRGKIQETGALLGVERVYKGSDVYDLSERSPSAITLCHAVVLCLKRDALLGVVEGFPESKKHMRRVVCRMIIKEKILAYSRAIIASVRGAEEDELLRRAGDKTKNSKNNTSGVQVIRFMLGEHSAARLTEVAEAHRLRLLAKERPEEFKQMEDAVKLVQRLYRGHLARKIFEKIANDNAYLSEGANLMFRMLFKLRLHKYAGEFQLLGLEPKHLAATTALEICQITSLPFKDAAEIIIEVRRVESEGHDSLSEDSQHEPGFSQNTAGRSKSIGGLISVSDVALLTSPQRTARRSQSMAEKTSGSSVSFSNESKGGSKDEKATDPKPLKQKSSIQKSKSSRQIFAARAFAGKEAQRGLTVLLAVAKFKEGGERRRARLAAQER